MSPFSRLRALATECGGISRTERPLPESGNPRGAPSSSRAGCAAAFAFVFDASAIANGVRIGARSDCDRGRLGVCSIVRPYSRLERARNQHGESVARSIMKPRSRVFGRSQLGHRSTHSTNAGGMSSRTIITRTTRSSRISGSAPLRAASMVGYRVHAAASPDADPRLIVTINLSTCRPRAEYSATARFAMFRIEHGSFGWMRLVFESTMKSNAADSGIGAPRVGRKRHSPSDAGCHIWFTGTVPAPAGGPRGTGRGMLTQLS